MSVIVYKNARFFVNGIDIAGQFTELTVNYSAEMLDNTAFGQNTRTHIGGLNAGAMSGKAFWSGGANGTDAILFSPLGVEKQVLTMFPDGISEGSTSTGTGYACLGIFEKFSIGAGIKVGAILTADFAAQSQGLF